MASLPLLPLPSPPLRSREKVDAEKAAAESAAKAATAEIKNCEVSTSSCGKEPAKTCWNCDEEMTFDHQCDIVHPVGSKPSPPLPCWKCDKVFNVDGEGYIPEHHCVITIDQRLPGIKKCERG